MLSCTQQLVVHMPQEAELVTCAAQCLIAFSAASGSRNPGRLAAIVASEHTAALAKYITYSNSNRNNNNNNAGANQACRLNGTGLAAMFEATGQLFIRAKHDAYFNMVRVNEYISASG